MSLGETGGPSYTLLTTYQKHIENNETVQSDMKRTVYWTGFRCPGRAVDAMAIDAQAWPLDGGNRSARQVICIYNIQALETGPLLLVKRLYFRDGTFKECKCQHSRLQEIFEARKTGDVQTLNLM